jgi:uncharacterized pyridoxamine 5'-phosphate oxidase family protein
MPVSNLYTKGEGEPDTEEFTSTILSLNEVLYYVSSVGKLSWIEMKTRPDITYAIGCLR